MTSSNSIKILAVIPLRLASSRVPRKILADIGGKSLSARTLGQVQTALGDNPHVKILAAVDDIATVKHLKEIDPSLEVILTSPGIPSGTDRVFAATQDWLARTPEARKNLRGILNIQGDMPFAGVDGLRQAAGFYESATDEDLRRYSMITLAQSWPKDQPLESRGAVKVLTDRAGGALYFSRHPIPYSMNVPDKKQWNSVEFLPVCQLHIGLYGYTLEALSRLASHAPIDMERGESLEQLRALWLGIQILVLSTEPGEGENFRGLDTPEDLRWARNFAKPRKAAKNKTQKKPAAKKKSASKKPAKKTPAKKKVRRS